MTLIIEDQVGDIRGKIIFLKFNNKSLNLVEIKKGYSRGGHYHEFDSYHQIIKGKIEYRETSIQDKQEKTYEVFSPTCIFTPKYQAHIITALEDSIFIETFDNEYSAINFPDYRKIVEDKMKK